MQLSTSHVMLLDMKRSEKLGQAAKRALISLRERMGTTQQAFAAEFLKSAVTTVARYETSNPPRGEVLLKLSDIARANGIADIADEFRFLYLDEIIGNLGFEMIVSNPAESRKRGYLVVKLEG